MISAARKSFCLRQEVSASGRRQAGAGFLGGFYLLPRQEAGRSWNFFQSFEAVYFCLRQFISAWGAGRRLGGRLSNLKPFSF